MTGLVFLDIAIGVIFLLLVFSLFASAMQEAISAIFNLRAKSLQEGVRRMLGDIDGVAEGKRDFEAFWNSPLIESLKGPTNAVQRWVDWGSEKGKRNPSAIPTDLFVKSVLLEVRKQLDNSPAEIADLVEALRAKAAAGTAGPMITRVAAVLDGIEAKAEDTAAAVERALAGWYEGNRERFAGWYIRRTQWILFVIGLVLAVITNTDPIRYGIELRENDALRQQVSLMAEEVAALEDLEDVVNKLVPEATAPAGDQKTLAEIRQDVLDRSAQLSSKLDQIGAAAGWTHCGDSGLTWGCFVDTVDYWSDQRAEWSENGISVGYTPIGWVLLAIGVMLGAQFWLDILRRFVSIRSAGTSLMGAQEQKKQAGS